MKKAKFLNLTPIEVEDLMINEFGHDGDVSRIAKSDINEDGESVSKIYRLEDTYLILTVNFDTYEREVNFAKEQDSAQKIATEKLLTV